MTKTRLGLTALALAALALPGAALAQWTPTGGGDHNGWDWTPDDGTTVGGDHVDVDLDGDSIGVFTVLDGTAITVAAGGGTILADNLHIDGDIDAVGGELVLEGRSPDAGRTPTLISPKHDTYALPSTNLDWNDVTDPPGTTYRIQVSKTGTAGPTGTVSGPFEFDISGIVATIYDPVSDLGNESQYFWRVQAEATGTWSEVWSFKVDTDPPPAPPLANPADAGCVPTLTPALTWTAVTDFSGVTYNVAVATDAGITAIVASQNGLAVTTYTPTLPSQGTYYWRVTAVDGAGNSTNSAVASFTADTTAPAAFTLATPTSGTTTNDPTPTVTWSASSDANSFSYVIEFDDDIAFGSTALMDGAPSTATSYTPPVALADGPYYWRISAVDCAGNTTIATNAPFPVTIDATAPTGLSLTAPPDGSTMSSGTPMFQWTTATDASAFTYTWEIAADPGFTGSTTVTGLTATSHTPSPALADGTYYWRVTAVDGAANSVTTGAWTLTVATSGGGGGGGTGAPVLVSPTNNATTPATQINLTWNPPSGFGPVSYYVIQLDTDPTFATPILWTSNTSGTVLSSPTLSPGSYWWRVQAVNSSGATSPWSTTWKLTVSSTLPPTGLELVSPPNLTTLKGPTVKLVWTQALDAGGDPATGYSVEVLSGASIAWSNSPTTTSVTTGSLANGTYTWRVRATDQWGNNSAWTSTWSFTVDSSVAADTTAPPAVTLIKPADGSTWQVRTLDFEWTSTTDPSGVYYTIEVAAGATVVYAADTSRTTITYGTLPDDTYTWRVRATDGAGNAGAWSSVWDFTVDTASDTTAPSPPTLISPANNSTSTAANVTLTWQPGGDPREVAYYEVVVDGQSSFTAPLAHQIYPTGTTTTLPFANGDYWWRARAYDWNNNASSWSATWKFTVGSSGGGGGGTTTTTSTSRGWNDGSKGASAKCLLLFTAIGDSSVAWLSLVGLLTIVAAALSRRALLRQASD